MVVTLLGIKIWWFKHRLTIDQQSSSRGRAGDSQQNLRTRTHSSNDTRISQQFRQPVVIQGIFRKREEEELDSVNERPKKLPPIPQSKLSQTKPECDFRPPYKLSRPLEEMNAEPELPAPPTELPASALTNSDAAIPQEHEVNSKLSLSISDTDSLTPQKKTIGTKIKERRQRSFKEAVREPESEPETPSLKPNKPLNRNIDYNNVEEIERTFLKVSTNASRFKLTANALDRRIITDKREGRKLNERSEEKHINTTQGITEKHRFTNYNNDHPLWQELEREIETEFTQNIKEEFEKIANVYKLNSGEFLDSGYGKSIEKDWENFEKLANGSLSEKDFHSSSAFGEGKKIRFQFGNSNDDEEKVEKREKLKYKSEAIKRRRPTGFVRSDIVSHVMAPEDSDEYLHHNEPLINKRDDFGLDRERFQNYAIENYQPESQNCMALVSMEVMEARKPKPRQKVTFELNTERNQSETGEFPEGEGEIPKPMQHISNIYQHYQTLDIVGTTHFNEKENHTAIRDSQCRLMEKLHVLALNKEDSTSLPESMTKSSSKPSLKLEGDNKTQLIEKKESHLSEA